MKPIIYNRVDTIFIHVSNLKESVRWYSKLFGLEFKESDYKGPIHTIDMGPGRPGLTLDNHCFDEEYKFMPSNQPLFNLSTDDINIAYKLVKDMGAEIVTEIETFPNLADFTFKDPNGNIIMICTCFT
ncbi:VOC family protein [Bacillus sp. FJAT-49732]|uniref:VOC family protein n=1 Tax=Lederbergia citrisecunda TaxID=2833583 RepID=A0A942TKV2_9BACI|nr:VOC family protein [Lederbergia citrisecunda]MBS4198129.1 VOC family protein [Lederbergia citrisecunda]